VTLLCTLFIALVIVTLVVTVETFVLSGREEKQHDAIVSIANIYIYSTL